MRLQESSAPDRTRQAAAGGPQRTAEGSIGRAFAVNRDQDPALFWNAVALEADRQTHTLGDERDAVSRGPLGSSRSLAIVHLAMHDAWFGITGSQRRYLDDLGDPEPGADASAALAAAAATALGALYPAQTSMIRRAREDWSRGHRFDGAGSRWGTAVARALLARRAGDPSTSGEGYVPVTAPGHHQVDPTDPEQGFYGPFYGAAAPLFAGTQRLQLDAPPEPVSPESVRALHDVQARGVAPDLQGTVPDRLGRTRTPAETAAGIFWSYDGSAGLGTPPRLYNQLVREVARVRGNSTDQNVLLLATVNAAMADAGILAWTEKYRWDLWRPVVAVRQWQSVPGADPQDGDVGWLPLGAQRSNGGGRPFTPNFPSYPSGHATFGAAALQVVREFYGQGADGPDDLAAGLRLVSDELNGVTTDGEGVVRPYLERVFPGGLWDMIVENGLSRVLLGVHWSYDAFALDEDGEVDLSRNVGGVPLGLALARGIVRDGLRASAAAGPLGSATGDGHGC